MHSISKIIFLLIFFFFYFFQGFSQHDSIKSSLSFDPGITRGRNINLWPIFKKFKNEEKKELQILFPVFSKTRNFKTPASHMHVLPLTILDSSAKGQDKRFFSLYYPSVLRFQKQTFEKDTIKSFKFLELAPGISFFNLSRSHDGLFVENNAFFFIWYKKDQQLKKTRFVVFPAYWYFSNKYDTTHVVPPLFFKRKGNNYTNLNIGLLYNYRHSRNEKRRILFPLLWQKEIYNKKDTVKQEIIFPLYWSLRSKEENNQVLFPLAYSFRNKSYNSFTFFPFFSSGHSPDLSYRHLSVFPLYWHKKNPDNDYTAVLPFWWNSRFFLKEDTVRTNIIFPFFWSEKSRDADNKIIFPFLYSFKNSSYYSISLLPLFSSGHSPDSTRQHIAVLNYWKIKNKHGTERGLFPIWWSKEEFFQNDTLSRQTIFPLYWKTKSKEADNEFFFPFVYKIRNKNSQSFTFLPFASKGENFRTGKKYKAVTPLYWSFEKPGERKNVFFPFLWNSRSYLKNDTVTKNLLFPFYWSVRSKERNHKVVFPLFFSFRDSLYSSFTFFPLFSTGRSGDLSKKHFSVFPFLWKVQTSHSNGKIIFPFWWTYSKFKATDTLTYTSFFPLYWSLKSKDKNNKVFLPFVFDFKNSSFSSFTVFPFYSKGKFSGNNNSYIGLSPLFWHLENGTSKKNILFPLYWQSLTLHHGDTIRKNFLFPFFWSLKIKDKNNKIFFPLVFSLRDKEYNSFTILPVFSSGHSPGLKQSHVFLFPYYKNFREGESKTSIILPLWLKEIRYFADDTLTQKILFPFYLSSKNKENTFDFILPFYFKISNSHGKSLTVLPFFSTGRDLIKGNKYSVISPLFWHLEKKNEKWNIFFPLFWNRTNFLHDDTIHRNTIFPVFWSVKSTKKNIKIFFPLIYKIRNRQNSSLTFFPFFSAGHSQDNRKKFLLLTPLAGYTFNTEKKRIYFFPLFNYVKQGSDTRSSALLFLYRKKTSLEFSKTSILWPLCEKIKSPGYRYFRIAPFVWFTKTDSSGMFSIQPFFYSYKSSTRNTFILSWFLFKKESIYDISASKSILWKVFFSEKFSSGDYETRVLHLLYANVSKEGKKEKSIFPFYHYSQQENGERSKAYFLSFYNYFKQAIPGIDDFYEEERIFWFIRLRSNYAKLKAEGKEKYLKRK